MQQQQNSPSEDQPTQRVGYQNNRSPARPSPSQEQLEYDESPTRAQFNTQRAQKLKTCFNRNSALQEANQHTPETIRRDSKANAHIRMSSNPHVIQFAQGGQDDENCEESKYLNLPHDGDKDLMYDPDQPRELLTSEIDVVSRVDPFRSSSTSLQGVVGE